MKKTILILIAIISLLVIGNALYAYLNNMDGNAPKVNPPVACTDEAKICPDGSAVGRTGPFCEFAFCPNITSRSESVISGSVTLSPVCPVERMPPDPQCAPKPFATEIKVFDDNGGKLVKTIQSLSDGSYTLTLPYGNYMLQATGGKTLPQCSPINLRVQAPTVNNVSISCDTGIR